MIHLMFFIEKRELDLSMLVISIHCMRSSEPINIDYLSFIFKAFEDVIAIIFNNFGFLYQMMLGILGNSLDYPWKTQDFLINSELHLV